MITRRQLCLAGLSAALLATVGRQATRAAAPSAATFEITRTPEEWRRLLTPQQYDVLRDHGTERAFTSPLDKLYQPGTYHCAACDLALFSSDTKFDSKTGWPSFWKPLDNAIGTTVDKAFFMVRTEVHCRRCGGHQGHVFDGGPPPTKLRYCINGVALKFVAKAKSQS